MNIYDEDVLASRPIRLEQLRQMEAYIAELPERAEAAALPPGNPREDFRTALGLPAPGFFEPSSARLVKIGEDPIATYFRCYVRVTPQMETYGLYLVPKRTSGPAPLVIAMHGGGGFPELAAFQGGSNYRDMVRGAVAEGYVVFAPLAIMYPYRDRDHGTPIPEKVRTTLDAALRARGLRLMGVESHKISRALDVLLERPEVDRNRVAMIGLSYGGFYTLYTAALDPRIGVAIASCSFRDRMHADPALARELAETAILSSWDLTGLISPRPLQAQSGIGDQIFPIEDVRRAATKARAAAAAAGGHAFSYEEFEGPHEFCGALAWPFLRRHLAPAAMADSPGRNPP